MLAKKIVEDTPPEIVMPDKRAFLSRQVALKRSIVKDKRIVVNFFSSHAFFFSKVQKHG